MAILRLICSWCFANTARILQGTYPTARKKRIIFGNAHPESLILKQNIIKSQHTCIIIQVSCHVSCARCDQATHPGLVSKPRDGAHNLSNPANWSKPKKSNFDTTIYYCGVFTRPKTDIAVKIASLIQQQQWLRSSQNIPPLLRVNKGKHYFRYVTN